MQLIKDLGQRDYGTYKKRVGIYQCDCGNTIECMQSSVNSGKTTRCKKCQSKAKSARVTGSGNPMYKSKANVKHGDKIGGKPSDIYRKWQNIKIRCQNEKSVMYYRYGGRGISICDEWSSSFSSFKEWSLANGYKIGLEIDRIDNDGNYEPNNCRYVTRSFNQLNKGNSIKNRFSEDEMSEIIECYLNTDISRKSLAKECNMSELSIKKILEGNIR